MNYRSISSTRVEFVAQQSTFPKLGFVYESFKDFKIPAQLGSILPKKELSVPYGDSKSTHYLLLTTTTAMIKYLNKRGLINKMPTFLCQRCKKRKFYRNLLTDWLLSRALRVDPQTAFHMSKAKQRNLRLCIESLNRLLRKSIPSLSWSSQT